MKIHPIVPALAVFLALVGLTQQAAAQGPPKTKKALEQAREAKLAKPFLKKATWFLDYDKARAEAKRKKQWLLVYFTRTYAP